MTELFYTLCETPEIREAERERMFELFARSYVSISRAQFLEDLSWKSHAGILRDRAGVIQGFTTIAVNPKGFSADYDVLFSGDTIISPDHWGTQELVRGFCRTAGHLGAENRKLYWYLISKGHRTYLYLPLFCRRFYPDRRGQHEDLRRIAEDCSAFLYPEAWRGDLGILKFQDSHGELSPELAQTTHDRASHADVAFFLQRNPGFERGDELVCVTELSADNLRGFAKRFLLEGLASRREGPVV
jgi:hypothetical protein